MVVKPIYNRLRPYLPRKWGVMGGVAVRDFRLFDRDDCQPEYSAGLLKAIEDEVESGDTVVDIATGRGVAAVIAARQGADVISYEGSARMVEVARETLEASRVDSVTIEHAIVGEPLDIWGVPDGAEEVQPPDLPECDVMILDCEGSESHILYCLQNLAETVIVETHPQKTTYVTPPSVRLEDMGYHVDRREYRPDRPAKRVLVATRGGE